MNKNIPRIIKKTYSNTPVKYSKNGNQDVFEKKTINVTHTISSSTSPMISKGITRPLRRSNKQITVNRQIEGNRGYTPMKRTLLSNNSSNFESSKMFVSNLSKSNTNQKPNRQIRVSQQKEQVKRYSSKRTPTVVKGKLILKNIKNPKIIFYIVIIVLVVLF